MEQDANQQRYIALVTEAERVVHEVKSALYEADFYGRAHGQGADHLLEDVQQMLNPLINQTLAEAAKLQEAAERGIRNGSSIAVRLYENKGNLQELLDLRVQQAKADNARCRCECDKTWTRIRSDEEELDQLRKKQKAKHETAENAEDRSSPSKGASNTGADGGPPLTLDGAHALLHAFASVLRPHLREVVPADANRRSPAQAVTLEFLSAAGGLQARPNAVAALNRPASAREGRKVDADKNNGHHTVEQSASASPRSSQIGLVSPGSSQMGLISSASSWQGSQPVPEEEAADQLRLLQEVGESF